MISLRPYQAEAVDAVLDYWAEGGGNPLVDLATGLGKSVVIAEMCRRLMTDYPDMRALMLVHVRELVEQNFLALMRAWGDAPAGIYSAGLGRRDTRHRITFASIQSVFRKARELGPRDVIFIDEAHLVPAAGDGMYRTLLEALRREREDLRVCGFTATPFRLDTGRLDRGDERLFDRVVYSYGIGPGIADGWLSPLRSKASATEIDVSRVAKRGGEFIAGALEAAADREDVTGPAVDEIVAYGREQGRRSWLVFCAGVKHAYHVRDAMRARGIIAEAVTGETDNHVRSRLVRDFKSGAIQCLTNAQVLTTGFDAPAVDLVAFLRPTLSTGLYLQMVGRGVRRADGKADCLILDFAGNVRRHGPVDTAMAKERRGRLPKEDDDEPEIKTTIDTVRAKECPTCKSLASISAPTCEVCGHEWPKEVIRPKHEAVADTTPILSGAPREPDWHPIQSWGASRHSKQGAPDSLCIRYQAHMLAYYEWLCFEHQGFAREKAERTWARLGGGPPPASVTEALERFDQLAMPTSVQVRQNGKFFDIVSRRYDVPKEAAE